MHFSRKAPSLQRVVLRTRPLVRRAKSVPGRNRGAQPGNSNRLAHGRYTQAEAASRAALARQLREADNTIIWATNILHARAALQRKQGASSNLSPPPSWGGRSVSRQRSRAGGGGRNEPTKRQVRGESPHPTCFARRPPHVGGGESKGLAALHFIHDDNLCLLREPPPPVDTLHRAPHLPTSTDRGWGWP
jgi:hypothetical protein